MLFGTQETAIYTKMCRSRDEDAQKLAVQKLVRIAIPACRSWILRRITCGLCRAGPMCQGFGNQKVRMHGIQKIRKTSTAHMPRHLGPFATRQDAPGTVPSSAERSDSANPSASCPACPAMERPSTSKSAIRVIGLAVVESPNARCNMPNIS